MKKEDMDVPIIPPISDEQIEIVRKLRDETGYGVMYCKKALIEANWNYERAISIARDKWLSSRFL